MKESTEYIQNGSSAVKKGEMYHTPYYIFLDAIESLDLGYVSELSEWPLKAIVRSEVIASYYTFGLVYQAILIFQFGLPHHRQWWCSIVSMLKWANFWMRKSKVVVPDSPTTVFSSQIILWIILWHDVAGVQQWQLQ